MAYHNAVRVLCHVTIRRRRLLQFVVKLHGLLLRCTPRKRAHTAGEHAASARTPRCVPQHSSEASTEHGYKARRSAAAQRPCPDTSLPSYVAPPTESPARLGSLSHGDARPTHPCDPCNRTVRVTLGRRGVPAPRRAGRGRFAVLRRDLQSFAAHAQRGMAA